MSLQTTYLVNGEWATRRVDIGDILARNRETNMSANTRTPKIPATGLLSRTLVHGPTIQWVLPARIRHPNRNDVVFVGDNFIQIKELVHGGHLEDIITKADFDSRIIGAKVINTRPELGLDDQLGLNGGTARDATPVVENLAPHILVLILASKEMIFLYARELPRGRLDFVHARRPLPADVSSLEEYGRNITIDPRSRAMAISASHKFFGIFSLKPPQIMQHEMRCGPLNPILEERFFRIEGDILRMEFLHPKASNPDRVILLLLVSRDTGVHVVIYHWNATRDLQSVDLRVTGMRRLPPEWGAPPILIPLLQSTSFLLVTPSTVHIFTDVVEQHIPAKKLPLLSRAEMETNNLIWTQWTRPMRHDVRNKVFDDIYICREDGQVLYLEIRGGSVERNSVLGFLGCNLDTGFAILDGGFEAGDLFVATGSMSSGGLFIAEPRKPLRCIQRIPNWAPTLDSVVVKGPVQRNGGPSQSICRTADPSIDRIFTCSGVGNQSGAVTEFRYGLEGRIGLLVDQEDSSSIVDLWAMPDISSGGTFCLISNPLSSSLILIPVDAAEELYEMDEESSGLNLNAPTLAASSAAHQMLIQVTDVSIHLSVFGDESRRYSMRIQELSERIIAAVINTRISLLATAVRSDAGTQVVVRTPEVTPDGLRCDSFGHPLTIAYEPISLAIEEINSHFYLFVGTSEGKLLVAEISHTDGLVALMEHDIKALGDNDSTACEYLKLLTTTKRGVRRSTLFCGVRNGTLVPFDIEQDQVCSSIGLTQKTPWKLGNTPVRIRGHESDGSMAIVSCGAGLWRLSFVEDEDYVDHRLEKILITDQNNPARMQGAVDIFSCIDSQPNSPPGGLWGSLLCVSENQLFACTLETLAKPVPREIHIPGNPKRIIYSNYLQKLVVAFNYVSYERDGEYTRCYNRPKICFIDPDSQSAVPSTLDINQVSTQQPETAQHIKMPTGASGEKVTALFDWTFSSGEHAYHMIVIGTSQPRSTHTGRLVYISARPDPHHPGQITPTIKYTHVYNHPVRAIASYRPSALVLAIGDEVHFQSLDPRTKKWRRMRGFRMESTPISISVKEPYIYVLTARHSVCILQMAENHLELLGQDGTDREGLDHVNLQGESEFILSANRGGSIIGYSQKRIVPDEKLLKPLFAAHIPHSIIRLNASHRPFEPGASEIVYGAALNGTLYQFTTLKEHEWRLLRFIQNISVVNPVICPYRARPRVASEDLAPTMRKPNFMHVDGDILSRVVDNGRQFLEEMMKKSPSTLDYASTWRETENTGRTDRFREFAALVVGETEDPFAAVMAWMGSLLRIDL